jgi:hypothetical protein
MAVLACGGGAGPDVTPAPAVTGDSLVIEIQNQNFYDATIHYLYGGGARQRLGTVNGNSQGRFTIRWDPRPIRFNINFVGAGETISDEITTSVGDILGVTLPPNAHRSRTLRIRE